MYYQVYLKDKETKHIEVNDLQVAHCDKPTNWDINPQTVVWVCLILTETCWEGKVELMVASRFSMWLLKREIRSDQTRAKGKV